MSEWEHHSGLRAVLGEAQRIGALGRAPIDEIIRHAGAFVDALPLDTRTCVDLGTGAGIPGLVLAVARPDLRVTLMDRREKRTDALHRAVRALGVESTTEIVCAEVETLVANPSRRGRFDAAVSRGFGPPAFTLTMSSVLVRSGGVVIISEPPVELPSRWSQELLREAEVTSWERLGAVSMFHVEHR
jgi:16S rRNA (guanine527-N7)-methyltransferase